jgi:hypothetical protein
MNGRLPAAILDHRRTKPPTRHHPVELAADFPKWKPGYRESDPKVLYTKPLSGRQLDNSRVGGGEAHVRCRVAQRLWCHQCHGGGEAA